MRNDIAKAGENSPGMELMRFAQQPGNEISLSISKSKKIRQRVLIIQRGRQPLLQIGWHLLTIWPGGASVVEWSYKQARLLCLNHV
jgi:hypothetical protein